MDKEEKEKKETPIIDGDARPDMPVDPEEERSKKPSERDSANEGKVTSERMGDMNSLEDFRDSK